MSPEPESRPTAKIDNNDDYGRRPYEGRSSSFEIKDITGILKIIGNFGTKGMERAAISFLYTNSDVKKKKDE